MSMDERTTKSLDLVTDVTKQLITLTTAMVAFTQALGVLKDHPQLGSVELILAIVSVCVGLLQLLVITGTVASRRIQDAAISIFHPAIVAFGLIQLVTFVAALALLAFAY
jgi:hypothetical protein